MSSWTESLTMISGGDCPWLIWNSKQLLDQITFSEPGYTFSVAAATHEGISRCYVSISRQSGSLDSEGRNRIEVVRLDEDKLVVEQPILPPGEICPSNFGPTGTVASPDGKRIYSSDRGCARVHIIDADPTSKSFHTILGSPRTRGGVIGLDVTPDGSRIYAANRGPATLACIDAVLAETDPETAQGGPACNAVKTIPLGIGFSGAGAEVAISPDGGRALCGLQQLR